MSRCCRAPPKRIKVDLEKYNSVILAPISEMYGRRPVYIASTLLFTILIIPCGLATSLPEVVIVRFFGALAGSAMVANRFVFSELISPLLKHLLSPETVLGSTCSLDVFQGSLYPLRQARLTRKSSSSPGTVSDIVNDDYRALAFSIWSIGPFNGPTFGPIIGGFSTQ